MPLELSLDTMISVTFPLCGSAVWEVPNENYNYPPMFLNLTRAEYSPNGFHQITIDHDRTWNPQMREQTLRTHSQADLLLLSCYLVPNFLSCFVIRVLCQKKELDMANLFLLCMPDQLSNAIIPISKFKPCYIFLAKKSIGWYFVALLQINGDPAN